MLWFAAAKAGFIIALTLTPAVVWVASLGRAGLWRHATAATLAFLCAQGVWFFIAGAGIIAIRSELPYGRVFLEVLAIGSLIFAGARILAAPPATSLAVHKSPGATCSLFVRTFVKALAMPIRLPLTLGVMVATGVPFHLTSMFAGTVEIGIYGLLGALVWWAEIGFLAVFVVRRVPEPITLRSINRLHRFSGYLYFALAGIVILFMVAA